MSYLRIALGIAMYFIGALLLSASIPLLTKGAIKALGVASLSSACLYIAKRLTASSAERDAIRSKKPIVLYLRSFVADETAFVRPFWANQIYGCTPFRFGRYQTDEEALASSLRRSYRLVAVGDPGEWLPKLGASRLYRTNETWQSTVLDLLTRSSMVIIRVGDTQGLRWEFENIRKIVEPSRVLLWNPPAPIGRRRRHRAMFDDFVVNATAFETARSTDAVFRQEFLSFDDWWHIETDLTRKTAWTRVRCFMSHSRRPEIAGGLQPHLRRHALKTAKTRPSVVEVGNFLFYVALILFLAFTLYRPRVPALLVMRMQGILAVQSDTLVASCPAFAIDTTDICRVLLDVIQNHPEDHWVPVIYVAAMVFALLMLAKVASLLWITPFVAVSNGVKAGVKIYKMHS